MSNAFPQRLIVMALELEGQGVFESRGIPVLYCGVGKVNATYALTRRLADYRHAGRALPHVLNFGTAGSRRHPAGTALECHAFVQRDMDVSGLGVPLGATPFDADIPMRLEFPPAFPQLAPAICGTGDSFATSECAVECDVVDMEGYALAKVCWLERTRFTAVKWVSDGADGTAGADWQSNLHHAAERFLQLYEHLEEKDS
ncbi:MAG TPA: 5'-nucleosidase [Steroidobacteraceae bacterium]|jgi:adenosylhomocysteine nucleosidase|nr:5'-nucleosidase [Steroidobacteraceae bacterium]